MAKKESRKKILADHKPVGRKLVPPLLQIGSMQLTSWVDTGLPEAIWLSVLSDRLGHLDGVAAALELTKAAVNTESATYAFASDFEGLRAEQWTAVCQTVPTEVLRQLRLALNPFLRLFPECPLKFILDAAPSEPSAEDVAWFKPMLASMFAKGERPATLALATVVYLQMGQGRLFVHPGSALLNLPAVEDYPETDESRRVGAIVRATVNSFSSKTIEPLWPRYFWTRSFELEPCFFADDET